MPRSLHRLRQTAVALVCSVALSVPALAALPAAPVAADAPSCGGTAGDGLFVDFIYLSILDRCPDPGGADYWKAQLNGGLPRWDMVEAIDMSTENILEHNLYPLFNEILDRDPTPAEVTYWGDHIREKHADAELIATLIADPSFWAALPGTTYAEKDEAWLSAAYNGILDRDPDTAGHDYYWAQLGDGSTRDTRYAVAIQLEFSLENAADWTEAVYFAGLHRPPDGPGFDYWLGWLTGPGNWQTFRMWTHILASDESYANAQLAIMAGEVRSWHS